MTIFTPNMTMPWSSMFMVALGALLWSRTKPKIAESGKIIFFVGTLVTALTLNGF